MEKATLSHVTLVGAKIGCRPWLLLGLVPSFGTLCSRSRVSVLDWATISDSDLSDTDFRRASLNSVTFRKTTMGGTNFTQARLDASKFVQMEADANYTRQTC